ncbi:MAG: adenylate/guanylate cyclase domain-containing protein [Leptolyngbyaceae cyanobacterium]
MALAAIYFIGGKITLSFATLAGYITPVWPVSGVALAALLLWGRRLAPGIFLGAWQPRPRPQPRLKGRLAEVMLMAGLIIASRMESLGEPNRIQVAKDTYEYLGDRFIFEARGLVDVKGKGLINTYWLVSQVKP